MVDWVTIGLIAGIAAAFELTNLYFILQTRKQAAIIRAEVPQMVDQTIEQVKAEISAIDFEKAGVAGWEKMRAAFEGVAGAAVKDLTKRGSLTSFDAIVSAMEEAGSPAWLQGLIIYGERASGGKLSRGLFTAAKKIPYIGKYIGEETETSTGEIDLGV